jgi:AcrR family transcriptional regulator
METRSRGRPRQYDRETALNGALQVFCTKGFTATSLDDLAAATGMNRPSLYNAFGDKEALYRETLEHFISGLRDAIGRHVAAEPDLQKALQGFYKGALQEYFSMRPARGCFAFTTAPVEALTHPEFQRDIKALVDELDELLTQKFAAAKADGSYPNIVDPKSSAKIAQGVLHSLAIRSRAGESKASLTSMAMSAVAMLCDS